MNEIVKARTPSELPKIIDVEQGSEEWFSHRAGLPTASDFGRIITPVKGEPSKQARSYALKLIGELAGDPPMWGGNRFTQMGHDREPEARDWLAFESGSEWEQVGLVIHDSGLYGCSPDALCLDGEKITSGCEIKCKTLAEHIGILESGIMPDEHKPQVHGSMIVCGLDEWRFLAYHQGCKEQFLTVIKRDDYTNLLQKELDKFVEMMNEIKERYLI